MKRTYNRTKGAPLFAALALFSVLSPINDAHGVPTGDLYAYYTRVQSGEEFERFSRTGEYPDIIVQVAKPSGQLVFWRGNSYLPYWKTGAGRWDLPQILPRSGDGTATMPDRVNLYSHAEIIENTPSRVIVHWRYLASFTAGNPHGNVDPNNFVEEVFTLAPEGRITRVIKRGTRTSGEWNDPLNQTAQVLQLGDDDVSEISRKNPGHLTVSLPVKGNPEKCRAVILGAP